MCGIIGVISKGKDCKISTTDIYRDLLLLSEIRGKEASGFAFVDKLNEKIVVYKAPQTGREMMRSNVFKTYFTSKNLTNVYAAIGHSRLVTNGYEQFSENNQPVIVNDYVLVHNGIIVNVDKLWLNYRKYKKQTDLDTEIIPLIIDQNINKFGNIKSAISQMFSEVEGVANIAFFNCKNTYITLASNNGSLFYGFDKINEIFFFASEYNFIKKIIHKYKLKINIEDITQIVLKKPIFFDYLKFDFVNTDNIENNLSAKSIIEIPFTNKKKIYINKSFEHNLKKVPKKFINHYKEQKKIIATLRRCSRCILPETFPFIKYDEKGVCNYCNNYHHYDLKGESALKNFSKQFIKTNQKPEVLIGLSGGRDSCYALHYATKILGLKGIAYSYDWGMVNDLARRNQARVVGKLGIEHIIISADIRTKRANIRKNLKAWLKKPNLGMFQSLWREISRFFYYFHKVRRQTGIKLFIFCGGYEAKKVQVFSSMAFANIESQAVKMR